MKHERNHTSTSASNGRLYSVVFVGAILLVAFYVSLSDSTTASGQRGGDWIAPAWADTLVSPITDMTTAIAVAGKTFKETCAICHGTVGKGDGVAGVALKPRPANLTSDKVQTQSDGAVFWKLSTGKAPMPSYAEQLTEEQRWQMVAFIRSLVDK